MNRSDPVLPSDMSFFPGMINTLRKDLNTSERNRVFRAVWTRLQMIVLVPTLATGNAAYHLFSMVKVTVFVIDWVHLDGEPVRELLPPGFQPHDVKNHCKKLGGSILAITLVFVAIFSPHRALLILEDLGLGSAPRKRIRRIHGENSGMMSFARKKSKKNEEIGLPVQSVAEAPKSPSKIHPQAAERTQVLPSVASRRIPPTRNKRVTANLMSSTSRHSVPPPPSYPPPAPPSSSAPITSVQELGCISFIHQVQQTIHVATRGPAPTNPPPPPTRSVATTVLSVPPSAPSFVVTMVPSVPPSAPRSVATTVPSVPPSAPSSVVTMVPSVPPPAPRSVATTVLSVPPSAPSSVVTMVPSAPLTNAVVVPPPPPPPAAPPPPSSAAVGAAYPAFRPDLLTAIQTGVPLNHPPTPETNGPSKQPTYSAANPMAEVLARRVAVNGDEDEAAESDYDSAFDED